MAVKKCAKCHSPINEEKAKRRSKYPAADRGACACGANLNFHQVFGHGWYFEVYRFPATRFMEESELWVTKEEDIGRYDQDFLVRGQ